ncbi:DUF2303 family protein [Paraburkholderia panacisoli]|uniref:DUF2303 family protein n=1 Tax=Paraburkholderia panacisoli TaxID=2603818 RepID=UPI003CCC5295
MSSRATRLQDGSTNFVWKEDVNATGNKIAMPSQITLSIPRFRKRFAVFHRRPHQIPRAERHPEDLVRTGRPHKVLEVAFRAIWSQIEEQTATNILLGSPE